MFSQSEKMSHQTKTQALSRLHQYCHFATGEPGGEKMAAAGRFVDWINAGEG